MKLTNKINDKFGSDKIEHFAVTGMIVGMSISLGWLACLITYTLMLIIGLVKEELLDDEPDVNDVMASAIGGGVVFLWHTLITILG